MQCRNTDCSPPLTDASVVYAAESTGHLKTAMDFVTFGEQLKLCFVISTFGGAKTIRPRNGTFEKKTIIY